MLIAVRGLPGSGKSTHAKRLQKDIPNSVHIETDMYFVNDKGEYVYDPSRVRQAHEWCQNRTESLLQAGFVVIVANTFTQLWELAPYGNMCIKHMKRFTIVEMRKQYGNTHGVPNSTIEAMKQRWEDVKPARFMGQ